MEIKVLSIDIDSNSIIPTLTIGIHVDYYYNLETPIFITGKLNTSDGKTISFLQEHQANLETTLSLKIYDKETKEKIYGAGDKYRNQYHAFLTAQLGPRSIEHIETLREKHPERAVVFHFTFVIKYFSLPCTVNNMLDKQDATPFLTLQIKKVGIGFTINHSDWINNYSPFLGVGNFILLELEVPNKFDVSMMWAELYERLILRIKEMEEGIRHGDWQKALSKARQFYENLKFDSRSLTEKEFRDNLKELFLKDQHSEEGFEEFYKGVSNFFNYTSKFIHDKNRLGQLNPVPIPRKEDAYFAYCLAIGIINVIGRKIST